MNLKYYLRGLGIGIVVTALIMSIAAGGKKETLSDAEIRERAKALGMTESGTLLEAGLTGEESSKENEEASPADGALSDAEADDKAAEAEKSPEPEESSEPEESPESEEDVLDAADDASGQDEAVKPETEEIQEQNNSEEQNIILDVPEEDSAPLESVNEDDTASGTEGVTIQVKQGDGSYSICKKLEEAGLISSATEFDTFLCERGYDKKIRVGTFQIPGNADPEQIARILNGLE